MADASAETKKPSGKSKPQTAAPKATADKPKFQTAETAGKAPACFGVTPAINTVRPDEGKAGNKETLTG